ncbi:desulfoferrodoxin [methanogenic archaeon mixed culture ISO4-G1]|nr:desulfoferrodoxin [methanogenic archaeon mixed culture ISO4-G1]
MVIYKCTKCPNAFEAVVKAACTPKCCGEPMEPLEAKTGNPAEEKHVPFVEWKDGGVLVKVGKEAGHPMTEDHYIVFIQICADGIMMRKYLKPGDAPEAFFKTEAKTIRAWEYCNKHGLWKSNQ